MLLHAKIHIRQHSGSEVSTCVELGSWFQSQQETICMEFARSPGVCMGFFWVSLAYSKEVAPGYIVLSIQGQGACRKQAM